jgi:hypothetical protein
MATRKPRKKRISKHAQLLKENRHRYDELLKKQNGVCAICGRPPKTRRLDLDHDHHRMVIRGLLCSRCNRFLVSWMTKDWLLKASEYIDGEA